jgi:hypothetical protein
VKKRTRFGDVFVGGMWPMLVYLPIDARAEIGDNIGSIVLVRLTAV